MEGAGQGEVCVRAVHGEARRHWWRGVIGGEASLVAGRAWLLGAMRTEGRLKSEMAARANLSFVEWGERDLGKLRRGVNWWIK